MENATTVARKDFASGDVIAVSTAHGLHDTYQAFLPSFIPVFIENLALSKTQAGLLSAFSQLPSLSQPFLGLLADRKGLRWMIILAPAVTAVTSSLLGVMPNYLLIVFLLVITGFSSAAMHSVGPAIAGRLSGSRLGKGMSYWMVAGELGRALGPLAVVTAIQIAGLNSTPWLMVAGLAVSILLFIRLKRLPAASHAPALPFDWKPALRQMALFMLGLGLISSTGFFVASAISTFLPTYLTERGVTLWFAGAALTIYELAGVMGAMVVGPISDRFGRKPVLMTAFVLTPIFMLLFTLSTSWLKVPGLILLGFSMLSINPVLMAWVQERFPNYRAFANGIFMSMNFVFRSGVVIVIGWLADRHGLQVSYLVSAAVMLLAVPVILFMPETVEPSRTIRPAP